MTPEALAAVTRWRGLAAEARETGSQLTDIQAKLIMLSIAQACERMAQRAEERAEQQRIEADAAVDASLVPHPVPGTRT